MAVPFATRRVSRDEHLDVVGHLDELRRRLLVSLAALVVAFAAAYAMHTELIELLSRPLPDGQALITLSPTEPFVTTLKVTFWAAVLLALPVWLYQVYAFAMPALSDVSRRASLAVVSGVSALFAVGVAFGYVFVLPAALDFLLSYGDGVFLTEVRAGEYFAFATTMLLATGALFELPVAMVALARIGAVDARGYRRGRRIAIVVMALVAALLPGGDPFSMLLLLLPQLALYEIGILCAAFFGGRRGPALS